MLGECIANHFLGSNNKIVAHDVLLSNIYAAAGRWDDVEKVQKDMKANWVKKSKAVVGSRSMKMSMFPREQQIKPKFKEKIFILGKIPVQMKDVEYVLVTNFILLMFRRSGRNTFFAIIVRSMSIVFGLLYSFPRTPIWIVKNLHKCGDFHSTAKFILKFISIEFLLKLSTKPNHLNVFGEHV
jgi:hypothetical protein